MGRQSTTIYVDVEAANQKTLAGPTAKPPRRLSPALRDRGDGKHLLPPPFCPCRWGVMGGAGGIERGRYISCNANICFKVVADHFFFPEVFCPTLHRPPLSISVRFLPTFIPDVKTRRGGGGGGICCQSRISLLPSSNSTTADDAATHC